MGRPRSSAWYDAQYDARGAVPDQAAIRQGCGARRMPVCEVLPSRHPMKVLHGLAAPGQHLHALAQGLLGLA